MPDDARDWTDAQLERLRKRMEREYSQAAKEMRSKLEESLKEYNEERERRKKAMNDTPESRRKYKEWLSEQAVKHNRMSEMVDSLSKAAVEAGRKAVEALNDYLPGIFTENVNRAAFDIDRAIRADTRFALVDESTVRNLMGLGPKDVINREVVDNAAMLEQGLSKVQSVRMAEFDAAKQIRWNRQKFNSAITQGILQGESIPNIVRRTRSIFNANSRAAYRAARTATTSAENAGRVSSYERAQALGIPLIQEWIATLDERTRSGHRELDGQQRETGVPFSSEHGDIMYPGDPQAHPSEVWNCRCTLRARIKGFENERQENRWSRLPEGMTYEEWKEGKNG